MNKYKRIPEFILDLHGHTTTKTRQILDDLVGRAEYHHVRIITGKATFRETGPVLRNFVEKYFKDKDIKFSYAKLNDGGEGALEVYLKE
jgi:DNA-nicking Smr family endonuclease